MQKLQFHMCYDFKLSHRSPLETPSSGARASFRLVAFLTFPLFFRLWVAVNCGSSQSSGRGTSLRVTHAFENLFRPIPSPTPAVQIPLYSGGRSLKIEGLMTKVRGRIVSHSSISQMLCTGNCLPSAQVPRQFFNM